MMANIWENGNFPLLYLVKCPYIGGWVVQKSLTPLRNKKMAPNFDIKRAFEINLDHKKIHRRFDEGFF